MLAKGLSTSGYRHGRRNSCSEIPMCHFVCHYGAALKASGSRGTLAAHHLDPFSSVAPGLPRFPRNDAPASLFSPLPSCQYVTNAIR